MKDRRWDNARKFERDIMKALGLENVKATKVVITLTPNNLPVIEIQAFPQNEQSVDLSNLPHIIKVLSSGS